MKTVLLLFGGESTEHDVSVASAKNVDHAIDPEKFTVVYGYIDRKGAWWFVGGVDHTLPDDAKQLLPVLGEKAFSVSGTETLVTPDVILPILHGRNGEDGSVQALGQLLHIPVVGCDMTASAAAMNKYLTKQLAIANGINVAPYQVHYGADAMPRFDEVAQELGNTVFVKPANAGSSVGVNKATDQQTLEVALAEAHQHDDIVLIEAAIDAREMEIAVLGNYPHVIISEVSEIMPDREFYTFESKYDESSASQVVLPADIPEDVSKELQRQASRIFRVLGGSGLSRIDFFVDKHDGTIYLNEVNTLPGFTNISVYPKAWEHAGISYGELIERLIQYALDA